MNKLLLILLIGLPSTLCLFAQAITPATGTWVILNTTGYGATSYPISPDGYEANTYIPGTSLTCLWGNYLTQPETSEGQDAMGCYNYATNRVDIVSGAGAGWHSDHRPGMGHQMGAQVYIPSWGSLIWNTNLSYGNDVDQHLSMYGWDGHTTYEIPLPSISGTYNRPWFNSDELNAAAYEPVTGTVTFFGDSRTATGEATVCSPTGSALQMTCTAGVASPSPGNINIASMAMTGANNGLVYVYGGGAQNGQQTTLNGAVTSSSTTITVASGTAIANGNYETILAESTNTTEVVLVTAGGGTTSLTVTRGVAGTSASAHSSSATFTSASQALYTFNPMTPTSNPWAQPATTCNVSLYPDCIGNAPNARFNAGLTYDPDDGVTGSLFLAGGTTAPQGSGSAINDSWLLNLSTMAWQELCGPGLNTSACANFAQYVPLPGNRLVYDAVDHVALWMNGSIATNHTSLVNGSVSAYAVGTIAPLAYGRTTYSGLATAGSLNVTTPTTVSTNNVQGNATDPYLSTDGTNIYLSHIEDAPPASVATNGNCMVPQPYVDLITFSGGTASAAGYPTGSLLTRCKAIGGHGPRLSTGGWGFSASVGGTVWNIASHQNVDPHWGETQAVSFAQAYNTGTNAWQVPYFPPQAAPSCSPSCATSTGSITMTLSPYPAGVTNNNVLLITGGTGAAETVPVTGTNSGAGTITVTTANTHTGAWTIQDSGWVGCFTVSLHSCIYTDTKTVVQQYPQGLIAVGTTPTIALLEQNRDTNPGFNVPPEVYLYLAQPVSGQWTSLTGSTALNVGAVHSGTLIKSASMATDGGGSNIMACWAEEIDSTANRANMTTTPQIHCGLWNGSSFSVLGGSLNQSAADWGYTPSVTYYGGKWYCAYVDRPITGWPNVYVKVWNGTSWVVVGSGSLNNNTSTGAAFHPSLATDGSTLYVAWEEQSALGQNALGYIKSTTGSSWASAATAVAANPTGGSVEDINIVAISGKVTAAWAEELPSNLRQVYSQQFTPGAGCRITNGPSLTSGYISTAYSITITTAGCSSPTWSVTAGTLPAGLSLNPSTGVVSGTPRSRTTFNFSIGATGATPVAFTLAINGPAATAPLIY